MLRRGLAVAVAVAIADQASKAAILALFAGAPPDRQFVLAPFLSLLLSRNSGVSFGFFNNGAAVNPLVFSAVAVVVIAILIYWLSRIETALLAVAVGLIVGGAAGNVIDRVRLGRVIDFIDFHVGAWHWPTFNVADSAICIGVAVMLLEGMWRRRTTPQANGRGDR
jgi:signal peptidase II